MSSVSKQVVEPGTIIVLNDVDLSDEQHGQLVEAVRRVAGHDRFCFLRVTSGQPVTLFTVDDVLAAITEGEDGTATDTDAGEGDDAASAARPGGGRARD